MKNQSKSEESNEPVYNGAGVRGRLAPGSMRSQNFILLLYGFYFLSFFLAPFTAGYSHWPSDLYTHHVWNISKTCLGHDQNMLSGTCRNHVWMHAWMHSSMHASMHASMQASIRASVHASMHACIHASLQKVAKSFQNSQKSNTNCKTNIKHRKIMPNFANIC